MYEWDRSSLNYNHQDSASLLGIHTNICNQVTLNGWAGLLVEYILIVIHRRSGRPYSLARWCSCQRSRWCTSDSRWDAEMWGGQGPGRWGRTNRLLGRRSRRCLAFLPSLDHIYERTTRPVPAGHKCPGPRQILDSGDRGAHWGSHGHTGRTWK